MVIDYNENNVNKQIKQTVIKPITKDTHFAELAIDSNLTICPFPTLILKLYVLKELFPLMAVKMSYKVQ